MMRAVDVDVMAPKAAQVANVGSPRARLARMIRPEVVELRKVT